MEFLAQMYAMCARKTLLEAMCEVIVEMKFDKVQIELETDDARA